MRVMKRSMSRSAFTLIELLLVLVILGVLAAVVVPKFTSRGEDARKQAAKTTIEQMGLSLDMFETDNGRYPTTEEGLAALLQPPQAMEATWKGPYVKNQQTVPADPWGRQFVYRYPGAHNEKEYDLSSLGPDGSESEDDISNWGAKK
jgi:general secretion pathway protein G